MYRMGGLSSFLASRLISTTYVSLPNIIANKKIIEEFLQETDMQKIADHLLSLLEPKQQEEFAISVASLKSCLKTQAAVNAANKIVDLVDLNCCV